MSAAAAPSASTKQVDTTPEGRADLSCVSPSPALCVQLYASAYSIAPYEGDSEVMNKLLVFTVAMVVLPIGTYFLSRDYVYSRALSLSPSLAECQVSGLTRYSPTCTAGTSLTYPALSAVVVANGVLGAFIYVAFREDAQDAEREKRARIVSKAGVGKAE